MILKMELRKHFNKYMNDYVSIRVEGHFAYLIVVTKKERSKSL